MSKTATIEFLTDLIARRGQPTPGYDSIWSVELLGGNVVEATAFEPDPASYRHDYYYNASTNTLYKKVVVRRDPVVVAHWQKVSD